MNDLRAVAGKTCDGPEALRKVVGVPKGPVRIDTVDIRECLVVGRSGLLEQLLDRRDALPSRHRRAPGQTRPSPEKVDDRIAPQ